MTPPKILAKQESPPALNSPKFELLSEGRLPNLADATLPEKPGEFPPAELRFYEPPQDNSSELSSLLQNPAAVNRLKIASLLQGLERAEKLSAKLEAIAKQGSGTEELSALQESIGKAVDVSELQRRLFQQLGTLLHPENHPVPQAEYTRAINQFFAIFYGESKDPKRPYFTEKELAQSYAQILDSDARLMEFDLKLTQ